MVSLSPKGNYLAAARDYDDAVLIWDIKSRRLLWSLPHPHDVLSLSWSPDEKRIVSASWDAFIRIWNVETATQMRDSLRAESSTRTISWSPNGKYIAYGCISGECCILDADNFEVISRISAHNSSEIRGICWNPGSNRVATASTDKRIAISEAKTGKELLSMEGHKKTVLTVAWSPDGNRIASGSEDRSIIIWDANSGEMTNILEGHRDDVDCITFNYDGTKIISGSHDWTLRVWDISTKCLLEKTREIYPPLSIEERRRFNIEN